MRWRNLRESDLTSCLQIHPEVADGESEGTTLRALRSIFRSPSFNGVAIETDLLGQPAMVGSGAGVFVKDEFVRDELAHPRSGMTKRILAAQLSGSPVTLSRTEIAKANGADGLNAVTLWGRWRNDIQAKETIDEIRLQLATSYAALHAGYFFKRIILEIRDFKDRSFALDSRLCRIVPVEGGASASQFPQDTGSVALIEASDVNGLPGSILGRHFNQLRPVLGLQAVDQELLLAALDGALDQEIGSRLRISTPAVKRRWATLYSRIEDSHPTFFGEEAMGENGHRGLQKRHRILAYTREHPEELRPCMPVAGGISNATTRQAPKSSVY